MRAAENGRSMEETREMLATTAALYGQGVGDSVALITDGRFSGGTRGFSDAESVLGLLRSKDRPASGEQAAHNAVGAVKLGGLLTVLRYVLYYKQYSPILMIK